MTWTYEPYDKGYLQIPKEAYMDWKRNAIDFNKDQGRDGVAVMMAGLSVLFVLVTAYIMLRDKLVCDFVSEELKDRYTCKNFLN